MNVDQKYTRQLTSPWFLALILLGLFSAVTGYKYGWDDQHLEIPLLKKLIDASLYQGDYYVESLRKNFSSYFYPILAKLITKESIPAAYLFLFLVSRYFLFYWTYKLWLLIAQDKFKAFACVFALILVIRVEEFLYRTFSHQEFTLAIIAAAIYFFFKERYYLASLLLGIGANFHSLYCLFPMIFILNYLLVSGKMKGIKTLLTSGIIFTVASLPVLVWIIANRLGRTAQPFDADWLALYITSCPQNFFFPQAPTIPFKVLISNYKIFLALTQDYLFIAGLFILNLCWNDMFRRNKKALTFCFTAIGFLIITFIFTYLKPSAFVLDLNLIRNTQFLLYLLSGFTMLLILNYIEKEGRVLSLGLITLFLFLKFDKITALLSLLIIFLVFLFNYLRSRPDSSWNKTGRILTVVITSAIVLAFARHFSQMHFQFLTMLYLAVTLSLLITYFFVQYPPIRTNYWRGFIIIPMCVLSIQHIHLHQIKSATENQGEGFWRLQRSWEDMQRYVRSATPKDAMILIPYNMEMCGFRILSERKVVTSYRDCGIIGFDYQAAVEWKGRISDISEFQFQMTKPYLNALKNAIEKYKADYIVFRRYAAPKQDNLLLRRIYTNMDFDLFEVLRR